MPPSKLDKYLNILEVLMQRPQKIDKIADRTHIELPELKRRMNFLTVNGVVEKRRFLNSNQAVYALNDRGFAVLKSLRAFKYFERLKESMPIIDEAREIASLLQRVNKRKVE
jgi:DNA-binding IclR family transcriptional regulator